MIDKEILIDKMKERGFEQYSFSNSASKMIFMLNQNIKYGRFDVPRYTIEVNLEDEKFKASYIVPFSVNIITTGWCGSVMLDNHFDNITSKFEMHTSILNKYAII
jgi:hypothetical protein